jgi:ADP-heptose:LPS heptosyltransferase
VIRVDAIGDLFLWLAHLRALAAKPEVLGTKVRALAVVASKEWAPFLNDLRIADRVIPFDRDKWFSDFRYRLSFIKKIRREKFDICISPAHSRDLFGADAIAATCGAPMRVAPLGDNARLPPWLKRYGDTLYTRLIECDATTRARESERNEAFSIALLGTKKIDGYDFSGLCSAAPSDYFVVAPGSRQAFRQWGADRFATVAQRVVRELGLTAVICGSKAEFELCSQVQVRIGSKARNEAGEMSLTQLVKCIAGARFVIANESAAVHIAAAVGTPTVCIAGGGHFNRFVPYPNDRGPGGGLVKTVHFNMECFGCQWHCRYVSDPSVPRPCISEIKLEPVWSAICDAACRT